METYMARKARKQHSNKANFNNMVIDLKTYQKKKITILPRNVHQEDYIDILSDSQTPIAFATGPAGTGKTMLAVQMGIQKFESGEINRIVITRPAVSVDEQHGFLPGSLKDKMAPWTRPIFDVLEEHWDPKQVERMIESKEIEIAPLAYMRGRTFKECWIVADEMQNATPEQMKMLLTRIGTGSKIVVTGDLAQHDRGYDNNGLKDFTSKLTDNHSTIKCVHFTKQDVERHPAVIDVLSIYGE
jgi:phosphate starvation-inducible PhoH-like protein|tara:strand:+ start:7623 stop:8351 length:729 start_codon:yes stop_codon:yes gene_type:complete